MPFDLVPIEMLDPADGTEGQIPVIGADGKFGVGDQAGGGIESVVPGAGINVDNTDPANPIVSATGGVIGLVPLTTVIGGVPELVWDADNQLVMTEAP